MKMLQAVNRQKQAFFFFTTRINLVTCNSLAYRHNELYMCIQIYIYIPVIHMLYMCIYKYTVYISRIGEICQHFQTSKMSSSCKLYNKSTSCCNHWGNLSNTTVNVYSCTCHKYYCQYFICDSHDFAIIFGKANLEHFTCSCSNWYIILQVEVNY